MVDLHPQGRAVAGALLCPALEKVEVAFILDHHIAGLTARAMVDHDVAGDAQADATFGPGAVQRQQAFAGPAVLVAHGLVQG